MLKKQPGALTQPQIDLLNVVRLVGSNLPNHALRFLNANDVALLQGLGLLTDVSPRRIVLTPLGESHLREHGLEAVPWERSGDDARPGKRSTTDR